MTLKMKFLGYKKEVIRPLNDARYTHWLARDDLFLLNSSTRAVEAGANFLSEAFIFSVAAAVIIAESWR